MQMRVLFDYHELWGVVESGVSAFADNATKAQRVAHPDQKQEQEGFVSHPSRDEWRDI